jgi:hypothetical protein
MAFVVGEGDKKLNIRVEELHIIISYSLSNLEASLELKGDF